MSKDISLRKDIRETALYNEAADLFRRIHQVGSGLVTGAGELDPSPEGQRAVFTGTLQDKLEGLPNTRICLADLKTGDVRVMTYGPNTDRAPKFSPDGTRIAFLSDRKKAGDFQLYLLDLATGAVRFTAESAAGRVDGWVEYFHWSPDGTRILLGVAGHGADVAAGQGAATSKRADQGVMPPPWLPEVATGEESIFWRRSWIYDLESGQASAVVPLSDLNIWEAVWCGEAALAAIASPGSGEGLWYTATLNIIDIASGKVREVYKPKDQLGHLTANAAGDRIGVVEALCSDRGICAGQLLLIDTASGRIEPVATNEVDITSVSWRTEDRLCLGGHRAFETVILDYQAGSDKLTECWASDELTGSGIYLTVRPLGAGDSLFLSEGFLQAPAIGRVTYGAEGAQDSQGDYHQLLSFGQGASGPDGSIEQWVGSVEQVRWPAPDGLEIHGWLVRPKGDGPHPLVLNIHGGPVWSYRPGWPGLTIRMLLKHGYGIFSPNPRGSTGRGQDFARMVYGDMGGAETSDHLSGLDYLIEQGIADPKRLGVMGGSHGGFMTSWIITQDSRFAAAVSVAPVTNWVSLHLTSNIAYFASLVLGCRYYKSDRGSKNGEENDEDNPYLDRSPVMQAHKVKTPTLNICGALDRCTPPGQAREFHNALLEHEVKSALVTYPEEGHGVRQLPAVFDYAARVVSWFEEHMPAAGKGKTP